MRQLTTMDGTPLTLADRPPRLGGEAAVYDADGPWGPCVVKLAHDPGAGWLAQERALLEDLGRDPATRGLVPRVLGHGTDGARPFVVLERFPATLADLVGRGSPAERLRIAGRVAAACAALRAARPGLVHRDLKPSNFLVDGSRVVVTDFGIAREPTVGATTTTRALLTPGYAPPEQALPRRTPDPSWDTFALAATLCHLLAGEPAAAPGANAWRLTDRGLALRAGEDDGSGPPWAYLDLADAPALLASDRQRLAAYDGPLADALAAAMAPDPRRRTGTPATLLAAVQATRPAGSRGRAPVLAGLAVAVLAGAVALAPRASEADLAPEVARIAGGPSYGSGGPVAVAPYLLMVTEVDQALWEAVTGYGLRERRRLVDGTLGPPCDPFEGTSIVGPELPMACVDWLDAVRFANGLSARTGLAPAYRIDGASVAEIPGADGWRLPTLAEFRVAARGAVGGPARDNSADALYKRRFPSAQADPFEDGWLLAAPVRAVPAGPNGVRGLLGNVGEWLSDAGPPGRRWIGGIDWGSPASPNPPDIANPMPATTRWHTLGLRLARSLP